MIFPSTADVRAIVRRGGVPGYDVTLEDVKTSKVIWGCSVLKVKGNTVRKNGKGLVQSIIKVPLELIKLHQVVELMVEIFCRQKHLLHYLQHEDLLFHGNPFDDT